MYCFSGSIVDINSADENNNISSTITITKDKINLGQNVWFTSYSKDGSLFASNTDFTLGSQIIGAGISYAININT